MTLELSGWVKQFCEKNVNVYLLMSGQDQQSKNLIDETPKECWGTLVKYGRNGSNQIVLDTDAFNFEKKTGQIFCDGKKAQTCKFNTNLLNYYVSTKRQSLTLTPSSLIFSLS